MLYDLYVWSVGICNCNGDLISILEIFSARLYCNPSRIVLWIDCMLEEVKFSSVTMQYLVLCIVLYVWTKQLRLLLLVRRLNKSSRSLKPFGVGWSCFSSRGDGAALPLKKVRSLILLTELKHRHKRFDYQIYPVRLDFPLHLLKCLLIFIIMCCECALSALEDLYNSFMGVNILSIQSDPLLP